MRARILIMCEGETERNYFQAIKEDSDFKLALSAVNAQVITAKNRSPEQVVAEAVRRKEEEEREGDPYDQIWVVFDHDNHPKRKYAYDEADKLGFSIAFSAIAFETWFLLHFFRSARAFPTADQLIRELRKYYPDYEKAKQNDFFNLKENLDNALENAEWLRQLVLDEFQHPADHNPWTEVDKLVLELIHAR